MFHPASVSRDILEDNVANRFNVIVVLLSLNHQIDSFDSVSVLNHWV